MTPGDTKENADARGSYSLPRFAFLALLLAIFSVACLKKMYDYDIWFHLSVGREVFTTWRIPATEFLVYTLEGVPTIFHAWGYGVIMYLLHLCFGIGGLSVFNALLGGAVLVIFFMVAIDKKEERLPAALLLLVPLFLMVSFRFVYRPEMFTYLFLGLELILLERFLAERALRYLYPVPLLCFMLTNVHPSTIVLIVTLTLYAAQYWWEARKGPGLTKREAVTITAVVIAALAGTLLNPYGYRTLLLPFTMTSHVEYVRQVVEFVPTLQTIFKWPAVGVAAAAAVALLFDRRRRPVDWLMLLFFGYMGFGYVRALPFLVLVAYPAVVAGLTLLLHRFSCLARPMWHRIITCFGMAALAALLVYSVRKPTWGVGIIEGRFPVRAAELMLKMKPNGRLFNSEGMGGYLGWRLYPEYGVSVDGRHFDRDLSLVLASQVFEARPGWDSVLDSYNVTTIFTPAVSPMTGVLIDLLLNLDSNEDWILLSAEPAGLLFGNRRLVPAFRNMQMPDQNLIWWQVIDESRHIPVAPERANALLSSGIAAFQLHRPQLAADYLRQYVSLTPLDVEAAKMLMQVEAGSLQPPAVSRTKYRSF